MNIWLGLYMGEILFTIGAEIVCEIRYEKLKKELGYVNVRESEFSRTFSESPILATIATVLICAFPLSFIIAIKENINFKYSSLESLKEELDKGIIKLKGDNEVHPLEMISKIKSARKSAAAAYLEYLEEVAKQQEQAKDLSVNNVFEADKSAYEEKRDELKKLRLEFDSTMRRNFKSRKNNKDDWEW